MFFSRKSDDFSLEKQIYLEDLPVENRDKIVELLSTNGYIGNLQTTKLTVSMITDGVVELAGTQYYLFNIPEKNPLSLAFDLGEKTLIHILEQSPPNKRGGICTHYHTIAKIDGQRLSFNDKAYKRMLSSHSWWKLNAPVSAIYDNGARPGCVLS